jgi:hypothetical protein
MNDNIIKDIDAAIQLETELQQPSTSAAAAAIDQTNREALIIKVQFLEEILKLREEKKRKEENHPNETKKEKAIRLLMKDELNDLINVLSTQTGKEGKKHPKFYYWAKMFTVSETEPPQLLKKEKAKVKEGRVIPETQLVVVAAEEMFDKCMEIHNNVGKTSRLAMEIEAKKFYSNISRSIIEIFLKYSEEYQV